MKRHWTGTLVRLEACDDAVTWAKDQPSFAAAWDSCERGDWMLWLLFRLKHPDATRTGFALADIAIRRAAAALKSAADIHPGETHRATLIEHSARLLALPPIDSRAAARAASDAARAARTAARAARDAAWAASTAARAASDAAWAASYAARAASDPAWAASYAAWAAESKRQADWIRANVKRPALRGAK